MMYGGPSEDDGKGKMTNPGQIQMAVKNEGTVGKRGETKHESAFVEDPNVLYRNFVLTRYKTFQGDSCKKCKGTNFKYDQ
jgi:hypothetical protein